MPGISRVSVRVSDRGLRGGVRVAVTKYTHCQRPAHLRDAGLELELLGVEVGELLLRVASVSKASFSSAGSPIGMM